MTSGRLPVIFFGHGSPMNAIESNDYSDSWKKIGESLQKPKGVVCISAHWVSYGMAVTAMEKPRTIHDFMGFPRALSEFEYSAPGSPELAELVINTIHPHTVSLDNRWGFDHGTWVVLHWVFPHADVPVVQLSIDHNLTFEEHYHLGRSLRDLRDQNILVIGSGNLVHNLSMAAWEVKAYDWAVKFDEKVKNWILNGDHESIIHYEKQGPDAAFAVSSKEHYIPLLYTLGAAYPDDKIQFFNEDIMAGSISMRGVRFG